jgi:glutamate/tyrosine decarboxylase-like PLP-dependent enzyme
MPPVTATMPDHGLPADDVLARLGEAKREDVDWKGGRVFALVYHAGEAHDELLRRAHAMFASANLLNPVAFKGLRRLEAEIVQMVLGLFNAPATAVGSVTSGGTESILLAVKTMRDRARRERPWIRSPELVLPRTAHPAFDKGAHYFGLKLRKVDLGPDLRVDVGAFERRIGRNTIGLVGSAPQYPHGVVDPIRALGEIALRSKLPLHVDACVGGFILPWLERLGRPVPPWDFRVDGVTSISADLHKYAYAGKGASVLLWRSMDLMKYQFHVTTDFPGGIYASPTVLGTRPGAWASLVGVGVDGYLGLSRAAADAADRFRAGIAAIPGLVLLGDPDATIVTWAAGPGGPAVYAVADRMEARGWTIERQQKPPCVHLTVTANHAGVVDSYLADLRASVDEVVRDPSLARSGTAPMYGMMGKVPLGGLVAGQVRKVLESMYAPGAVGAALPSNDEPIGKFLEKHGAKVEAVLDKANALRDKVKKVLGR